MPHIARYQNRTVPRDSRSAAKSQDRAAPRVPCPAASSKPSGTSSPMPCDPTSRTNGAAESTPHDHHHRQTAPQTSLPSLCGKAGATPSPRLAAKPERRRAPASRPKQRGTAAPRLAERRRGTAAPPCGKAERRRRSTSRTRQNVAAVSTPCLTDKADRRRGLHPPLPHGQGRSAPRPRLTPRGQEANMPPRELSDKCAIIRERHNQPGARSGRRATAIRICHTESKARRIATRDAPEYNSPANSQIGNRIPSDNRNTRKGNLLGWILRPAGVMRADKHSD